ncbi:CPBP family intramembrane glutamic endopeptidase [Prescottella subtropica]|uniref:CPBP family intramembrane glutamic endopeptidase n=1 Tax=Prescottella subtropica TaxID=2545757 RepID=UPI0010F7EA23|nr:CPBP family intramembrane glutamic endopeptidase [Prescottella subtropica]
MITRTTVDSWLRPAPPEPSPPSLDARERRALWFEITIVLLVTFGLSGISSALSLLESALQPGGLSDQAVALNPSRSTQSWIDLARQLLGVVRLAAWAALGLYLLWRSGLGPRRIGLGRVRDGVRPGVGLAALIGLPGLAFYLAAVALNANLTVMPSTIDDHWWRLPVLVLWAIANSGAEEILVVAYLISRLRRLGWSENSSLLASALLRGSYHLYQGFGGGLGNVLMGLVFGRYWQRTGKLWPLVIAHALIDSIAFVGYALLRGHVSWLP